MLEVNIMKFDKYFEQILVGHVVVASLANILNIFILCILITCLAVFANYVFKKIIIRVIKFWVDRSTNKNDDIFYEKGVFNKLSHLAPALLISYLVSVPFAGHTTIIDLVKTATNMYILIVVLLMLNSVINAFHEIYNQMPSLKNRSIKGYVHSAKSIVFFIGSLMVLSILIKKT